MKIKGEFLKNTKYYQELFIKKAFPVSLFLVAFSIPFPIGISNIFIIFSFILWLFFIEKSFTWTNNLLFLFASFLPFYFLYIVSIFYSGDFLSAISSVLERKITFVVFPIVLICTKTKLFDINKILIGFLVGFLVISFFSITEILLLIQRNNEPLHYVFTHYTRWNFTENSEFSYHSPYMGLHAVFCILITLNLKPEIKEIIRIFIIGFLILLIYILGTKISFLLLLILCFYFLFRFFLPRSLSPLLRFSIYISIVTSFGLLFLIQRENIVRTLENEFNTEKLYWGSLPNRIIKFLKYGDEDRISNWESALCGFKMNPLFGSGVGDSLDVLQKCREVDSWNFINQVNTHNQYLDILLELGILGISIFSLCLFCSFCIGLKNKKKLYMLFLLTLMVSLSTENMFDRQKGIVYFTFFNALFLSNLKINDKASFKIPVSSKNI